MQGTTKSGLRYEIIFDVNEDGEVYALFFVDLKKNKCATPFALYLGVTGDFEHISAKENTKIDSLFGKSFKDFKANEDDILKKTEPYLKKQLIGKLKNADWDIDNFIEKSVYPFCYAKNAVSTKGDNEIIISTARPLKTAFKEYFDNSGTDYNEDFMHICAVAAYNVASALERNDKQFFKDLFYAYSNLDERRGDYKTPELLLYEMAFPPIDYLAIKDLKDLKDFDLKKPIPIITNKALKKLRENGFNMYKRASVQQLCNKMHLERLGGKGGRPKKCNESE